MMNTLTESSWKGERLVMNKNQFERTTINNIRVHVLPTERFKTYAISVYVGMPLDEDTVTSAALTPFVLRRGTEELPETIQFREKLDDLYGAGFGFDIYKRGDYQIIQFRMDTIQDQFVNESGSLLKESIQFLGNTLTKPLVENGSFRPKYVDAEKNTLQKRIEAIINDKIRYAGERCIQEMCKNEPYRLHPLGEIDDLEQITPDSLMNHYQSWMNSAAIDIYVVGNTTLEEVQELVSTSFAMNRYQEVLYEQKVVRPQPKELNRVVEKLDVNQGKLNMGLRTAITYADDKYAAALMYNGILGGFPHSKLFINVREKASLAYYAASRFDGHKGILTIQSGIEIANAAQTENIIQEQLAALKQGDISDLELMQTKAMIANHLREIQDSAFEMITFDFNRVLSGRERTEAALIQDIENVDKKHIQKVADQVQLDTIYFLRDKKGE
jgi:predicted Zn-dependent peptidase